MRTIKTIGIAGAGTMGAALAQKFIQEGFIVILADRSMEFVDRGIQSIREMLKEAVEKKVFTADQVELYLSNLGGTAELRNLKDCDLVVEAIYEDFEAKKELFIKLSEIVRNTCIIATNTSSFSVTELSRNVKNPGRFIGLHFFYHAAKNRLVEIIPGERTSAETVESIKRFAILAGKDAIMCADAYGFAVNRFFVPWLNEAVKLLEEGVASMEIIDAICRRAFGIGMGPFELMNATGVPVAFHAEKTLEVFGSLYQVSKRLEHQALSKKNWDLDVTKMEEISPDREKHVRDRMLGVVFFVCSQILDENVCTPGDLDKGAKIGLRWRKGPIELMQELGENEVIRIMVMMVDIYNMHLPASVGRKYWETEVVKLQVIKDQAVITIDQPENMNALSEKTMKQLAETFDKAEKNKKVKTIYITGSGKAFVAGADIKFFIKNIKKERICDIETFTEFGQKVFERIDKSKKKVIAVINGLALGGGLELALCADVILALPKAQLAFPETGIGIYPGLGGTQRSVGRIGKGLSKYLIHTGKMLNATDAMEIGLVDKVIDHTEMFSLFAGAQSLKLPKKKKPNEKWMTIRNFFERNSLEKILQKNYDEYSIGKEEAEKLARTISYKAPVALRIADKLIDEAKGSRSELDHLREIFSTSDALLGLSSIGKKVEYTGK